MFSLSPAQCHFGRTGDETKDIFRSAPHRDKLHCDSAAAAHRSAFPTLSAGVCCVSCSSSGRCATYLARGRRGRGQAALSLLFFFFCALVSLTFPASSNFPFTLSPPSPVLPVNASVFPFDELETAHGTNDLEQPLPYPFDATACSLSAVKELAHRFLAEKQGISSVKQRNRRRRGDPALEAIENAVASGISIEKVGRPWQCTDEETYAFLSSDQGSEHWQHANAETCGRQALCEQCRGSDTRDPSACIGFCA